MGNDPQVNIEWNDPQKIVTKRGKSKWVRYWVIPVDWLSGFFLFWEKNKDRLRPLGYTISKNKLGKWTLSEWQDRKGDFNTKFGTANPPAVTKDDIITESTLPKYKVKNVEGLREWQINSVSRLCSAIKKHGAAIDGSDTGTGKTYAAVAVARDLGLRIAVVCPKAVIYAWKKVITQHFKMDYEFILNYESVKTGKYKEIGTWKPVSKISTKQYFDWNLPKDTLIIFDESHRLKGHGTKNAEIAIEAKKQKYKILCCSATNAINPIELKTTGYILNLYKKNFTKYMRDHDCDKGRFGWEFGGDKIVLKKLHGDLFLERGIRLRKDEIEGFPDCEIIAEAYNIDESSESEMREIYSEMHRELKMLQIKVKGTKEYQINAMVIQLRARQKSELLKVPLIYEMIQDSIEAGMSVAVFLNFSDTIKALAERLKTSCIVWGGNKGAERDNAIAAFQEDKERVILINVKAGGAGLSLHDLNGTYSRISIISPTPSAVDLRQALGRVWRDGGKSKALQKIVFIANTEEEDTCERVKLKLENLDTINDGDVMIGSVFD
jgi:superfamily II DNA or RNA helicase